MATKRKKIGIFYKKIDVFPAINIYILNLIQGLKLLDENQKPQIIILFDDETKIEQIKKIEYPFIEFYKCKYYFDNIFIKAINKVNRFIFKKNYINFFDTNFPKDLDIVFPFIDLDETKYVENKIYWKPDFQEFHYPIYFSEEEINFGIQHLEKISTNKNAKLILSSNDSLNDFKQFYPNHICKTNVLQFVSFIPDITKINSTFFLNKFNIQQPYFFVANQFWPHKNHLIIFKAIKELKNKGYKPLVVCSGKTDSYRADNFIEKLKFFLQFNNITDNFIFTGFIDRTEQLVLMKNSLAVIQPSLFEGWSTVIEDAKALNHFVIASNLNVNIEQEKQNILFFEPHNHYQLSEYLELGLNKKLEIELNNYNINIEKYKNDLVIALNL